MALINCPECGKQVSDETHVCVHCGFPLKEKPVLVEQAVVTQQIKPIDPKKQKVRKIVGIVMCIISCICFVVAITGLTDDKYKFYVEHYEDCMDGYEECMDAAKYSSGYFASSYRSIASSYEKMAEDDMKEIWKYRGIAIVCCAVGIGLITVGCKNIKKGGVA